MQRPWGSNHFALDVTDEASIETVTQQIPSDCGTLDVVLNKAGYSL
jgi:NADP-dependent 3-hydroxy acid dehydrogenase YdfG